MTGDARCSSERAVAAALTTVAGQQVWLVSAHIHWHWPLGHPEGEASAKTILNGLYGPVVMAGDFNSFGWTARMARFAEMSRTELAGPILPTLSIENVPLPVDMALAPGGGRIERRGYFGSDHRGILAYLSLKP